MSTAASHQKENSVTESIRAIGLTPLARRFDCQPSAVQKWRDDGRLPQSELAGLTNYAETIAELSRETKKPTTIKRLLADTRKAWVKRAEEKRLAS